MQLVALLAKHNISSILDCHQDVLAPAFCGEGARPLPHTHRDRHATLYLMPASGVPEFISNSMYHNSSRSPPPPLLTSSYNIPLVRAIAALPSRPSRAAGRRVQVHPSSAPNATKTLPKFQPGQGILVKVV